MFAKLRGWKVAILAGFLTGMEALVNMGVPLPFQETFAPMWRALLIMVLSVAAFYYRWRATKEASSG